MGDKFPNVFRRLFCIPPPVTRPYSPGIPPSMASGGSDSNLADMTKRHSAIKKDDSFYTPKTQNHFVYHANKWMPFREYPHRNKSIGGASAGRVENFWLITWNIDFLIPDKEPRMRAALAHLEEQVRGIPAGEPVVICLQEMVESDIAAICASEWVRERFYTTDIDNKSWLTKMYGTTTLVDRNLGVRSVFRVPFVSKFDRDGLFVDLDTGAGSSRVIRVCNVHLESLAADPPVRPTQVKAASKVLHTAQVHAGLMCGDFNAIQPFDRTLHAENMLDDVYLLLGGKEDSDEGFTWGYQSPADSKKFGFCRMDKVLSCGAIEPEKLERIGVDVRTPDGKWVTDHYGLMAKLHVLPVNRAMSLAQQLGLP
ncbi:hypothetical protein EJ05DRAFT_620 [Pseudovirgaria hyperparasitica]|uniref:Endonuclease/exonuclease/phosphatase domain-containing protein n=1 Tax=Pseudovirgaria hyperparasitica TaxID=470096 RepID=A0A6A6WJH9_9PEZI|nr:uncharacterized protein EJ05DRAFT_620 [Pseudovirgaria hyperparasitica]KAF2762405.1 hypothetical protein EJ05DRAFT_620 [Pseudovirgaria hyperparasitica]